MSKEKQILQMLQDGYSQRRIASALRVSRNTVAKVVNAASDHQLPKGALESMDEAEIHHALFPEEALIPTLVTPDFPYIHKELLKSGVTLKLLWQEYVDTCRDSGKPPYGYSQYCKLYQDYVAQNNLTMHIQHKPGDKLMVDWAGTTLQLYDKVTGDSCKVYLFVATLLFSMYCYAQACRTMKEEDWINAHIAMYGFLGGVTRILTPDNLKVGILSNRKYEDPVINRSYQELSDHYHTALLPARVLAPRDKAAVEGSVGNLTSYIIARLRNRKFFDIHTMNAAIRKELDRFNDAPFQKKDGCRRSVFLEEELPFLQPLPSYPYEFAQWKSATVQLNYHISIDFQSYSVPMNMSAKKWMSGTPGAALRFITKGTGSAAINVFTDAVGSILHSRNICPQTISYTANGIRQGSLSGQPVLAKRPTRWSRGSLAPTGLKSRPIRAACPS